jgi:hypothetical protein
MGGGDKGKILLSKGLTKILLVKGIEEEDLDEGLIDFGVETFHFSVGFLLWISDTTMVIMFKSCCGAQCFLLLFWSFSRQHSHTYAALAHLTVSTSSSFLSHCFRFHRKVSRTVDSKGPFAHGDGERGDSHRERERERERERATLSVVLHSTLK